MDKKRVNPIVAERDDMIGRPASASRAEKAAPGKGSPLNAPASPSGLWQFMIVIAFFGLLGGGGYGWWQYQDLSLRHDSLQQRFDDLESRLSSTDESVTQSGAALQLNISKQGDELKKHWSEIRKLWGVTNDINKKKIEKNQKDISFLANKRNTLEAAIAKESKSLNALSANYLAINADMEVINNGLQGQANALDLLQTSIKRIDGDIKNNREAVKSMEAFRRQINQKIYQLEQPTNSGSSSGPN
ncbi:MAG: hypothetical protein P8J80_11535 [Porticoccaceae bacterium]|nr:hypothetical protein [Porticoccaceae bacterium]